jgi:hypothetical protein
MPATETHTNQNANLSAYIKLAYLLIAGASLVYFVLHMHSGATLVAAAAQASISLVYGVTALIVVFGVVIVAMSLGQPMALANTARPANTITAPAARPNV